MDAIPLIVQATARALGADEWLDSLPGLISELEEEWSFSTGRPFENATEAFVAEAVLKDGTRAVLKLVNANLTNAAACEIAVLRLVNGEGCPLLIQSDELRGAILMDRLGPSLSELELPTTIRHEILCDTVQRVWRAAPGVDLPTAAEKGRSLATFVLQAWRQLDEPCPERVVDLALACAERRINAHDDERAFLVHGDVHQWNALRSHDGFKMVDPDGLIAEREYDMGVIMREDLDELIVLGEHNRSEWLALRMDLNAAAIRDWGVILRLENGLLWMTQGFEATGLEIVDVIQELAEPAERN